MGRVAERQLTGAKTQFRPFAAAQTPPDIGHWFRCLLAAGPRPTAFCQLSGSRLKQT